MPNVVFRPRVSERAPSKTWFAELATAPGPQVIGDTGDNSFQVLFGREWVLEWSTEDDHLRLYQESASQPGVWVRVLTPLPPVFDAPLPATARRVSFAFDQSARMIVAFEDEGIVKVTRWDANLNQYVQNVSFAGVDPYVVMDATWTGDIPNSDVLIFYLSADRMRVMCRVQREIYGAEHEMWDYGGPSILDRALPGFLRYQLLVADASGAPLETVLLSDPYPYLGLDRIESDLVMTGDGSYYSVVLTPQLGPDPLVVTLSVTGEGAYGPATLEPSGADKFDAAMELTGGGSYSSAVITPTVPAPVDAAVLLTGSAEYRLVVLTHSGSDSLTAGFALGLGGSYGPP